MLIKIFHSLPFWKNSQAVFLRLQTEGKAQPCFILLCTFSINSYQGTAERIKSLKTKTSLTSPWCKEMLSSIDIPETTCSHCQFNISWVKAAFSKHSWLLISYLSMQQKQWDKLATDYRPAVLGLKTSL